MSKKGICISGAVQEPARLVCHDDTPLRGISSKVATLVLKLASGHSKSVSLRAEPALHVKRRFFYVPEKVFQAERAPGTLIAYDLHGRVVAHRTA